LFVVINRKNKEAKMPNAGLCVVTHNGKPLDQGGLRLGYGKPGEWFVKIGTSTVQAWPWLLPPKAKPAEKPAKKSLWKSLYKKKIDEDGEIFCGHCGIFTKVAPYGYFVICEKIVKCPHCLTEYMGSRILT
jgi:hypothetical protein